MECKQERKRSRVTNNTFLTNLIKRLKATEEQLDSVKSEINNIKKDLILYQHLDDSDDDEVDSINLNKNLLYEYIKENDFVVVYTDGACENNGKIIAKAGIGVWFGENHPLNVSMPVSGRATNNTAEIQACIHAVTVAHKNDIKKLKIKTDSKFVINAMTEWILKWKGNKWRLSSGGEVKNKEDFVTLDKSIELLDQVIWEYVEGHKGDFGNEQADKLARAGAALYKPSV